MHWSLKPAYREVPGVRIPLSPLKTPENQRFTLVFLYQKLSQACLNEGFGHKIQDALGGLVFRCFWKGSPSRDLLS